MVVNSHGFKVRLMDLSSLTLNVLSYRNWTACVCTRDAAVWSRPGPDRTDGLEPVRSGPGLDRFTSLWSVHITIKLT